MKRMEFFLWNMINGLNIKAGSKSVLFIFIMVVITGGFGGITWLIAGKWFLPDLWWLVCFIGYPAVFLGFLAGVIYLYNHEFA